MIFLKDLSNGSFRLGFTMRGSLYIGVYISIFEFKFDLMVGFCMKVFFFPFFFFCLLDSGWRFKLRFTVSKPWPN